MDIADITIREVWGVVLVGSLFALGAMVLICGIKGFGDILHLFRALREDDDIPTE